MNKLSTKFVNERMDDIEISIERRVSKNTPYDGPTQYVYHVYIQGRTHLLTAEETRQLRDLLSIAVRE